MILSVDRCSFGRNGGHTYGHWDCLCSLWIFSSSSVHRISMLRSKKAHLSKVSPTSLVFNPLRCKCFKLNWFDIKHFKVVLISIVQMSLINLFQFWLLGRFIAWFWVLMVAVVVAWGKDLPLTGMRKSDWYNKCYDWCSHCRLSWCFQSKCFICGIGKEYFDKVPHGFEKHVMNEHNFANYM